MASEDTQKKEVKKGPISKTSMFVMIMGIVMTAFFAIQSVMYFAVFFDDGSRKGGESAISFQPGGKVTGGARGTFMQAWLGWNNSSSAQKESALTTAIIMAIFAAGSSALIVLGYRRLYLPVEDETKPSSLELWGEENLNGPRKRRRRNL